ncbi:MAG TPA: putative baseplate assembly protein [Chloroflexota bacterium]
MSGRSTRAAGNGVLGAARPENRPGLQALAYRVGTHATFVERMLRRLATPSLARLTTRSSNDPAIALLDAWATVADVLTFYQERIANEGFLRTATERQSVLELARAIGYELNPGVAANALVAFLVEDAAGAPGEAILEAGLKVLSIPGQNERPRTFETIESLTVRAQWNVLRPRTSQLQTLDVSATELLLRGVGHVLEAGDGLLLIGANAERWDFRVIRTVEPLPPSHTRVTWTQPLDPSGVALTDDFDVFVLRQRAALFGYNAPDFRVMPDPIKSAFGAASGTEWPDFEVNGVQLDLDAIYPRIVADSWVILTGPAGTELYHIDDVAQIARTAYTLSAKVTRLVLDSDSSGLSAFGLRDTMVFAQAEPLPLAQQPIVAPVSGSTIELDRLIEGLHAGQRLLLTGPAAREAALVDSVVDDDARTTITLSAPLVHSYDPATLSISANVVRATHGETVPDEVLGSGHGGLPNQRFTLRQPPLTHVSASTPSGTRSTLDVRVDGVQWQEVPSLFGLSPRDQKYIVRIDDDGQTNITFGDGRMGARLSSGTENVRATYRSGVGLEGNVQASSLALLPVRPLGVRSVSNPLPASGAAAPERLDDARANAPLTVLTLDRIVSLRDFEDFTRAFAGVGKAHATRLWNGRAQVAHLTVGGAGGGPVDPVTTLPNLLAAIEGVRDPVHEVHVQNYVPRSFGVGAEVLVDRRFVTTQVLAAAALALGDAFSFGQRSFGQPVTAAEVIATVQAIAGVQAVNLTRLYFSELGGAAGSPPPFLAALDARWSGSDAQPAELILIDPAAVSLSEMPTTP